MCSAMPLRIAFIGSIVSPGCASADATGTGRRAARRARAAGPRPEQARARVARARRAVQQAGAAAPVPPEWAPAARARGRLGRLDRLGLGRCGRGGAAPLRRPTRRTRGCPSSSRGRRCRCPAPGSRRRRARRRSGPRPARGTSCRSRRRRQGLRPVRAPVREEARALVPPQPAPRPARRRRLPRSPLPSPDRRPPGWRAREASRPAAPAPSGAITASTVPTSTVSPSGTRIFATTPPAGLGTSVSTLSVEISRSDSSGATASPSCFSHFVIVPSETDTPIWGMTTSVCVFVAICPPSASASVRGELSQTRDDVLHLRDVRLLQHGRERHGVSGAAIR